MILTLSNGMRIAVMQSTGDVTYCGILVDAGTRDEPAHLPGLAHFVEHTIFKGTARRSSWHISNRMESIGGELNAYTNKEGTAVYSIAPSGYDEAYVERGIELIADLIAGASFPARELDKEREVIVEEINSYLDNPSESVFDRFEDHIYAGSSLAHNILGTPESVRKITGDDCRRFTGRFYNPANMVGFVYTNASPRKVERILERHWGRFDRPAIRPERTAPPASAPFDIVKDEDGHQAHTILGARMFSRHDPRRFALMLLNNYLAGPCMNSRLNQELREKRGLVYTVDSFVGLLSDTGTMAIYFGTDRRSVDRCLRIIRAELDALAQRPLSERQLNRIKQQYCGQIMVSRENPEAIAMSLGKNLLYYNRLPDIPGLVARLRDVTPEELREVAEMLAPDRCSRITLM